MTISAEAAVAAPTRRVGVMQPYFFPYAGYFRLLAAVDHFVIFDCVQFPRRGRVHRTQLPGPGGDVEWLTLPLARPPRGVLIRDLAFAPEARARFDERLARHRWIAAAAGPAAERLRDYLYGPFDSVIGFLERGLRLAAGILGLAPAITRSSELGLDPSLKGQDRVIAVVAAVGGRHYLNPPGGRHLYDEEKFAAAGLTLSFLDAYRGRYPYMLPALISEPPAAILEDIRSSLRIGDGAADP